MAYANARLGYHQVHTDVSIDGKQAAYFETDDDSAVLDPAILDADIMQSPDDAQLRKDSFANNNGVLSPADSQQWEHQYGNGLALDHSTSGASHVFDDEAHDFGQHYPLPVATYPSQQNPAPWGFEHVSGQCTPTNHPDFFPPPPSYSYNHPHYAHPRTDSARGSFSHPISLPVAPPPPGHFVPRPPDAVPGPSQQLQTPHSPHSHQEWMAVAAEEAAQRPTLKRFRDNSPARTTVDQQRRDGIRKKNGRIDIPQERNIHTIDELIDNERNEDMLKELKQQKRLLRNREAALASRQRKKKHTEDLETQAKDVNQTIEGLRRQLEEVHMIRANEVNSYDILQLQLQHAQRDIETLHEEKRDLVMRHTEETSTLRKRIRILTEQVEQGPAPAMSAVPSSTGFGDFNADMEALTMGAHEWNDMMFNNDLGDDATDDFTMVSKSEVFESAPEHRNQITSSTVVPTIHHKPSAEYTADQPVASGLLFFLLLCGAFVASKPASSRPSDLPQMPADVQAAAPTVLNSLLSESGSTSKPSNSAFGQRTRSQFGDAERFGAPHGHTRPADRMEYMHRRLTAPTRQQESESAFAVTPAQYASITDMDFSEYDGRPSSSHYPSGPSRPRRNLAEALASTSDAQSQSSKAEVYTRSLLWDLIPPDVVDQFREAVRQCNEIDAREQQQTTDDDLHQFKIEM